MQCPECGVENRKDSKYCAQCQASLVILCPNPECGAENICNSRFCDECGCALLANEAVDDNSSAEIKSTESDTLHAPDAVRRRLSVMYCDIIDSTLLTRKDDENWREALNNFRGICKKVFDKYEGYLARHEGDATMGYFGHPEAHEDDVSRTVLAGLEIVELTNAANQDLKSVYGIELHVRVGIDTGPAVVGGKGELPVGEPLNAASRVQNVAKPDTVVITDRTRRLLPHVFNLEDLGTHELRNLEPTNLFRVVGQNSSSGLRREERAVGPLVGRDGDLGLLLDRWKRVTEGQGQAVTLIGEPGIGKTRLVQALKREIRGQVRAYIECRGSDLHQSSALYPVIDHFVRAARIERTDDNESKRAKLRELLQDIDNAEEALPLVANLLSIEWEVEPPTILGQSSQRVRERMLEILVDLALKSADRGPTLIVFEDVQWFDPSSLERLERFIPLIQTVALYVVMTARPEPEFTPPWRAHPYSSQISLDRLQKNPINEMINGIAGGRALPADLRDQIATRTDGVPLYIEAVTRMVLESDLSQDRDNHSVTVPELAIPSTLMDSLTSRLDRLETDRPVAQVAATLGREFPYELLKTVSEWNDDELEQDLARLVSADLLYRMGSSPRKAVYRFKHALIRDAAYGLLTRKNRRKYHNKVGNTLQKHFQETVRSHPEVVAYHYSQAGQTEKAVDYWERAGNNAVLRSAHQEAAEHFEKGLDQLTGVDDRPKRIKKELDLQLSLGNSLRATLGWSADRSARRTPGH